jgi:hypothetical protein
MQRTIGPSPLLGAFRLDPRDGMDTNLDPTRPEFRPKEVVSRSADQNAASSCGSLVPSFKCQIGGLLYGSYPGHHSINLKDRFVSLKREFNFMLMNGSKWPVAPPPEHATSSFQEQSESLESQYFRRSKKIA